MTSTMILGKKTIVLCSPGFSTPWLGMYVPYLITARRLMRCGKQLERPILSLKIAPSCTNSVVSLLPPLRMHTNLDGMALHPQALDVDRVDDFLGGLDPHPVCSQILAMNPVPPVLEAYALVVKEDHH
ncbi:hypothetical protein L3X38_019287 [Prunus dulcis]|uniref:Uncharacterized protein n=1 Tax=Prunus dulcis TaxID=3755 RepID=A0AAD4ZCE8_PRUDU|nr:hypothetical protein L3X38_019287 [Prunus dulcis]